MTIAIIGNDFRWTALTTKRFNRKITKLVKKKGACTFLFTGKNGFDLLCWLLVSRLQRRYPDIKRVCAEIEYKDDDPFKDVISMYEESFLIEEGSDTGEMAESVRNRVMIEMSDVLLTYFDEKKARASTTKGYTELAIEQAQKMSKRVINLKYKLFSEKVKK